METIWSLVNTTFGTGAEGASWIEHKLESHNYIPFILFGLMLLFGQAGSLIERIGQPAAIGQILLGICLGIFAHWGAPFIKLMTHSELIHWMAEFGALLLLLNVGLETSKAQMRDVGINSTLMAIVGVLVPLGAAYSISPFLFEDLSQSSRWIMSAVLAATSVGLVAKIFEYIGINDTRMAQTVIGAGVIDDIIALMVLAIVAAGISAEGVTSPQMIAELIIFAVAFIASSLVLGSVFANTLSKGFNKITDHHRAKLAFTLIFAILYGAIAILAGLSPIVGAFGAGLFLDRVHFKSFKEPELEYELRQQMANDEDYIHRLHYKSDHARRDGQLGEAAIYQAWATRDQKRVNLTRKDIDHSSDKHVEELVGTAGDLFIPVFFIFTGMQVEPTVLLQPELYIQAIALAIIGNLGKMVAGICAKGEFREKLLAGICMSPRGEVGFLFAATGLSLGVLDDHLYGVSVLAVLLTTLPAASLIKLAAKGVTLPKSQIGDEQQALSH